MKTLLVIVMLFFFAELRAQTSDNIFIITTDGFRWKELFNGADSSLINDPQYVQDTSLTRQMYWAPTPEERRARLMPFFWNVIGGKGQLYGNRMLNNRVNVKNIYKISYPGYNELLTGFPDPYPALNTPTYNRNISVLEYLNDLPQYKGDVAAFSSWNVFPFILNSKRNKMWLNSGYEPINASSDSARLINEMQEGIVKKTHTRYDLLTYLAAREYIQSHHPKVVFISLGETDEFAHQGRYDLYLQQANNVDKMISELWYYVQTDPFYKGHTTFLITTDHGRGEKATTWFTHNTFTKGSGDIWLAMLGNGVEPIGEVKTAGKIYQKQIAGTIALLLGESFMPAHPVASPIKLPKSTEFASVHAEAVTNASQ